MFVHPANHDSPLSPLSLIVTHAGFVPVPVKKVLYILGKKKAPKVLYIWVKKIPKVLYICVRKKHQKYCTFGSEKITVSQFVKMHFDLDPWG